MKCLNICQRARSFATAFDHRSLKCCRSSRGGGGGGGGGGLCVWWGQYIIYRVLYILCIDTIMRGAPFCVLMIRFQTPVV